jgi:uncharacterized membrane protein YkvA (DUF1232 family)
MGRSRPKIGWLRALSRYYRDPSASVAGKLVIFLAMIYVVVPVDLIPDVPLIGWLDDLGVMGLATAWLARVVARYRSPEALPEGDESSSAPPRRRFSASP